jgi:hypothetical protein
VACPFNPAIAVQYSGQEWQAFDAAAVGCNGQCKSLKKQIKTSDFDETPAPAIVPLVNVTKT